MQTDLNLIMGAQGEIFETSDMYPAFIKKAQEEGNTKAVQVFTRAKLAESVHAERYLAAYNDIDAPDDDKFYLCPICGYIHKGENFEKCPICFCPKAPSARSKPTHPAFPSARNGRPRGGRFHVCDLHLHRMFHVKHSFAHCAGAGCAIIRASDERRLLWISSRRPSPHHRRHPRAQPRVRGAPRLRTLHHRQVPRQELAIVSCMDTRLTALLLAALGLKNGDAKIIKVAGARWPTPSAASCARC